MSSNNYEHRRRRRREEERQNYRQLMAGNRRNNNNKSNKNSTISEAQAIQKSLLRTHGLLQNELQRVQHVTDAIQHDGQLLEQTMDHHKSLNTKQASTALSALQRAQRFEYHVLLSSMILFGVVATYVLWSRVLLRLDIITPMLRMMFRSISTAIFGTRGIDDNDDYYDYDYRD